MLHTEFVASSRKCDSSLPCGTMARSGRINRARTALVQPFLAKFIRILAHKVGLIRRILIIIGRAENRQGLRFELVAHASRLNGGVARLVHHPFSREGVDAIKRRIATIIIVVVVNVVGGTLWISRDIHSRIDALVLARHIGKPLVKIQVIATFSHFADDNTFVHVGRAVRIRLSKEQIRGHHARRVNNGVGPFVVAVRALEAAHRFQSVFVTALSPAFCRFIPTFAIFQDRTSRNLLQITRQRKVLLHRKAVNTNLGTHSRERIHVAASLMIRSRGIPNIIIAKSVHGNASRCYIIINFV